MRVTKTRMACAVLLCAALPPLGGACTEPPPADVPPTPQVTELCATDATALARMPACAARADGAPDGPDAFDDALDAAGLDRCSLGYSEAEWAIYPQRLVHDPYRLPFFDEVHDAPALLPVFGATLNEALDGAAASAAPVAGALQSAAVLLGDDETPCVTPLPAPAADSGEPLADAVAALVRATGGTPDLDALAADASDVPPDVQRAVAALVGAVQEAHASTAALFAGMTGEERAALGGLHAYWLYSTVSLPDFRDPAVEELLAERLDLAALARAASVLALRVEALDLAALGAEFAATTGFAFDQDTPIGRIVIADGADHVHAEGPHAALFVDVGGNDTYERAVGVADASRPAVLAHHIGVGVDLGGADVYTYAAVPDAALDAGLLPSDVDGRYPATGSRTDTSGPVSLSQQLRQGAARQGVGLHFDLGASDDTYRSLRLSQGYGEAGVGVLYDAGGNDTYAAEAASQGAAFFGVGLLLDAAGNDRYDAFSLVQGFAGVRAVGALHDADGNDAYVTDHGDPDTGGDPLYWSIQIPGRSNNAFAQGAAWGVRCDGTAACMSGGLGVLRDRAGNDRYESSVQAQASGYWFGTGILADGSGADTYDARYYVQGAGAHFAMALFLDEDGDDRYNTNFAARATSIGVGHDYTSAVHIDGGGNDTYRAPQLSLGSGNANGLGVLLNIGGDDVYEAVGEPTLGAASFSQEWYDACGPCLSVATTGVFLDVGGDDSYTAPGSEVLRDDASVWSNARSPAAWSAIEHGVGVDADDGVVHFPTAQ